MSGVVQRFNAAKLHVSRFNLLAIPRRCLFSASAAPRAVSVCAHAMPASHSFAGAQQVEERTKRKQNKHECCEKRQKKKNYTHMHVGKMIGKREKFCGLIAIVVAAAGC